VYVRVIGSARSYQGTLHIVSHDTRPVEDHNEITHHLLETIFIHCQNTTTKVSYYMWMSDEDIPSW
jgi:replication factor A2